jgi:hypothetical protein
MSEQVQQTGKNIDRLTKILGYDPAKQHGGPTVFSDALKELQEEQDEAVKGQAKELLSAAIGLRKKMNEKVRTVNSEMKKFDKELGKLLNKIEAFSKGANLAEVEAQEKEAKEDKSDE